jgi:nucleoside-diphosphate-sugar epimerase
VVGEEALHAVDRVDCDVTDLEGLSRIVRERSISHIIHLAALQVPLCRENPSRGADVNVVGTVNVFEAARSSDSLAGPIVFASSVAAYDLADVPAGAIDGREPSGNARTLYGVYKLANEGVARIYYDDWGVSSIGLRPYTVFGVGRDQGMTASPTFAMLAAAVGRPWDISYSGSSHIQYAKDVAAAFIASARAPFQGADMLNLAGAFADMEEVVAAIEAAAPDVRGAVRIVGAPLPFPERVDAARFAEVVGPLAETTLLQGVAETVDRFRALVSDGAMDPESLLATGGEILEPS